jgi:anti-anti-sigma factor
MFQLHRKFHMRIEQQPGRTVLYLSGPLESHSALDFKKTFRTLVGSAARSVDIDLGGVTRLDGVGLASLVWAWREATSRGKEVRVTQVRPPVRQLVEQMNLHLLLRFVEERSPV